MALRLVTAPIHEPMSLEEAKAQCRIDFDDDDALIDGLIVAAREYVETTELSSALISQTWELVLDSWPGSTIRFPKPPLQSVTSITYTDIDGNATVYNSANYLVDVDSWPGRLVLRTGSAWPSVTLREIGGIVIRFVAGYGDAPENVPTPVQHALKLIVSDWYENRENSPLISGVNGVIQLPFAARQLLASYRHRQF